MNELLSGFPLKYLSIAVFVVSSFTYNVLFGRNMQCTCKNTRRDCCSFLLLPALACMIALLGTDETFQRICRHLCRWPNQCRKFICKFICIVLKPSLVGLLWTVSVLIDGNWYVCCLADFNGTKLECKDKRKITYEEKLIITDEKNASWLWGIILLIGILFLEVILSLCEKNEHYGENLFSELTVEEVETVQEEVLREKIKEVATRKIQLKIEAGEWNTYHNVGEDLIEQGPSCLQEDQNESPDQGCLTAPGSSSGPEDLKDVRKKSKRRQHFGGSTSEDGCPVEMGSVTAEDPPDERTHLLNQST